MAKFLLYKLVNMKLVTPNQAREMIFNVGIVENLAVISCVENIFILYVGSFWGGFASFAIIKHSNLAL